MKGHVPLNTKKNTLWALNCFREWMLTHVTGNERAQRAGNEDHMQILTDCCTIIAQNACFTTISVTWNFPSNCSGQGIYTS